MASEHHHLQLEKPPYPKVERPHVGRIKQRAERSNHKINLCAIRTSIGRDLGGPHLSIIQGGPELEVLFLYVFLCLETQVYKYIYVIVDHWFFWVTG